MFICENCNVQIPASVSSYLYTVETRLKTYPKRLEANRHREDGRIKHPNDSGGSGTEIAKQLRVCKSCYDDLIAHQS